MTPHNLRKLYVHHSLILIFFVMLTFSTCHAISGNKKDGIDVQCVDKERDALLHFKRGIRVDNCGLLASWGGSLDCCQWSGIRCNSSTGHVTKLHLPGLSNNNLDGFVPCLEGTLSDYLVELKQLEYLDLSLNTFHSIPKFIGSFANLKHLNLSNAGFNLAKIPNEIGNLSRLSILDLSCVYPGCFKSVENLLWLSHLRLLRYIDLARVDLSGLALNWFSIINNLPSLEILHMDGCGLSTKLPSYLSYINSSNNIQFIKLSGNKFKGTSIFQWLQNLSGIETTLEYLDLSFNQFSVKIPSFIWKINPLSYLNLNYNNMIGQIPIEVGNMQNLSFLDLGENDLIGKIPSEIWTIDSLSYISFANNHLGGAITNTFSNQKHLTYLDFSGNNLQLSRQAMKSLGKLCSLQTLLLSDNNLTYEFSEITESLSPCAHKSLVYLGLSNNKIWDSVPDNISNFSSLEVLYVDNNQLNGTISEGIGLLSRLQTLDLSLNFLSGVVSHSHFSNLSNLLFLNLSSNHAMRLNLSVNWTPPFQLLKLILGSCKIGPNFPKWLITQQNLTKLDISGAGINDVIPEQFWSSMSSTLQGLNMSNNMIHGELPDLTITFQQIADIDMSSNNLSGAIPSFLRNNVEYLDLNNNKLSQGLFRFLCPTKAVIYIRFIDLSNNLFFETLPDCWRYFPSLSVLQLQNNNISGNLPPSISAIYSLEVLHLRNNCLSGKLPRSWVNSTSLVVLDLAYNSLTGSIPLTFGDSLVQLRSLSLNNNYFSMGIPSGLCKLTSLQILDLSSNYISGHLPKCLYNLTMMANQTNFPQHIDEFSFEDFEWLTWNRKKQRFDVSVGLLKGIDISDNNLQGQIPAEITSLAGLVFLNLSKNNLSGPIPSRIGQLTSLNFLDLSSNHLSGEIPTSLALIDSLGTLDLSKNNLTGRIPLGTQLQGFNASSYMGNPGLCGAPLPKCLGDKVSLVPQNGENIAKQKVHKSDDIFLGLVISVVLGLITGFWGVCGTLVLKISWRTAIFRFYDDIRDRVYVMVVVNIIRPYRRS